MIYALTEASSCWIRSLNNLLYAFVAPFFSLLAVNFVQFLATSRAIQATRIATTAVTQNIGPTWEVSLYVRLSFLMGFTWNFGILDVFYQSLAVKFLFVMANSLTGVYLAVDFTCNSRVFDLYKTET
jgi:hypothetical protein